MVGFRGLAFTHSQMGIAKTLEELGVLVALV
jgi:hypothetical protein